MTNQEYFDKYLEKTVDYSNLDILEQLRLFRSCAPFTLSKIETLFGKDFVSNCTRIGIFSINTRNSTELFVYWDKLKDFEDFVKSEKERIDDDNLF
jgi:hypothetical protein